MNIDRPSPEVLWQIAYDSHSDDPIGRRAHFLQLMEHYGYIDTWPSIFENYREEIA